MEITPFVLGMLTIVAVIILTVIVVGLVKINKLEKQTKNLHRLCRNIDGGLRRLITDTNRDITMVERTIMQRIDKEIESTHRHIHDEVEEIHKHEEQIHREIDQVKSYTDSRIDKVVSSGTLKSSKRQILNG